MFKTNETQYLPENPGCYIFKDKNEKVLYVGKAKNIKKRVSSYFQKKDHDPKTSLLVKEISLIDIITTKTEVEALLLENSLIKKHYPKYNIDLKDSSRYAYILIHDSNIPWIEVARSRTEKGEYFGPFTSGAVRNLIIELLRRNFRVLTRKPSPRIKKAIDKETYNLRIEQARQILKGNVDELIKDLKEQMKSASSRTFFEYALTLRNQINALETLKEKQLIEMTKTLDSHIINYLLVKDQVYLLVFTIRKGVLEEKQEYSFTYYDSFFEDFLVQFYDLAPIPQEVILPEHVDKSIEQYLITKSKRRVKVIVPTKGDKKELLELVNQNIKTTFFAGKERILALKEALSLQNLPRRIECFDISHLSGTNTVASMTTFVDGIPDKSSYRKFKIRTAEGGDDYLAMKEVIERRYSKTLSKTMKRPDLIVIDGGKGQLSTAVAVLKELRINIPIISLAKRLEEVYLPGKEYPVRMDFKNKGLQLLQAIRDEAHRFALTYQRSLRKKELQ